MCTNHGGGTFGGRVGASLMPLLPHGRFFHGTRRIRTARAVVVGDVRSTARVSGWDAGISRRAVTYGMVPDHGAGPLDR